MTGNTPLSTTPGRLLLGAILAGLSASAGCGSGGGPSTASGPTPPSPADSIRTEAVNERILAAVPTDPTREVEAAADYRIGPEDQIEVEVFEVEEFSGVYRVDQAGRIALPLIGDVTVSGHTTTELEDTLKVLLSETYMHDPHVNVTVTEMQSHGVSVIGAVNQPGVYQVPGRSTVLEILAQAEGLSTEAGNQVYVVRPNRVTGQSGLDASFAATDGSDGSGPPGEIIEVDLGALLESGRIEENVVVLPGDIIQVRPAGLIYVVGEVNRPGGFTIPPGRPVTVLQALAMAEGLAGMASASSGMIVREHEDGSREEIPVNLEDVLEGEESPPLLHPRDVLFVPRNGAKSFATGVVSSLVRMVTFRGLVY